MLRNGLRPDIRVATCLRPRGTLISEGRTLFLLKTNTHRFGSVFREHDHMINWIKDLPRDCCAVTMMGRLGNASNISSGDSGSTVRFLFFVFVLTILMYLHSASYAIVLYCFLFFMLVFLIFGMDRKLWHKVLCCQKFPFRYQSLYTSQRSSGNSNCSGLFGHL